MIKAPQFRFAFFHPKYWFTWLGIIILYLISWLPYRLQLGLGRLIGRLLYLIAKRRRQIAKRNLELCFPKMPDDEQKQLLIKNFESTGIALFESSMGWWWPSWRLKKFCHYEGLEHIEAAKAKGQGVLMVTIHMMCLEVGCRVFAQKYPSVAFYRPHNNDLMEYFQYHGRARDNKYLIGAKNVKGLFSALADNELCFYLPDQDYGRRRSVFVPFFAQPEACTTTGTTLFAGQSNCSVLLVVPQRLAKGRGYKITVSPILEDYPSGDDKADAARLNRLIEEAVIQAPEQYLWLHRRFKTRPDRKAPSLYD
ncbi:LpxL/LpxP family Kdo(2)-lipid IV(A) lauroyl/palmitoleoyl acyltransferase [Gayadomonas joobiniege]|uniref:LpxL/LpxP family Kdo(2)-lipid IV(A) lauroyl/palmitoleoyl acyltransferase n=1 Tax=Gayadomonas joobiniege TaxID=1234606 RepID=UPI00037BFE0E|nr:LpxL/LpxP family Kdo(2)-lipid IV(A) lauroyl/palmitoleoyl acyltransferase [Gayadomonas joobiniege]